MRRVFDSVFEGILVVLFAIIIMTQFPRLWEVFIPNGSSWVTHFVYKAIVVSLGLVMPVACACALYSKRVRAWAKCLAFAEIAYWFYFVFQMISG